MRKLLLILALAGAVAAAAKLTLKDLPAAAQKTVNDNLKGGEIQNIGKETEHGVAQYEIETMLGGKHRDFNVDTKGNLLVVEEETAIDTLPPAAKAAILKKVGEGKLRMVEAVSKPAGETMYEASYTTKAGLEVLANSVRKDGGIQYSLAGNYTPRIPLSSIQMTQLYGLIQQARKNLEAVEAGK